MTKLEAIRFGAQAGNGLRNRRYASVPGVAILGVIIGLYDFVGTLRDALDPRRGGR